MSFKEQMLHLLMWAILPDAYIYNVEMKIFVHWNVIIVMMIKICDGQTGPEIQKIVTIEIWTLTTPQKKQ
jgi:hypothetical protein